MDKFLKMLAETNAAVRTIFLVGVLLFVGLAVSNYKTKTDMADYIEGYNTYKKQAETGVKYSDSLKTIIGAHEKSSAKLLVAIDAHKNRADSIARVRPKPEVVGALQHRLDSLQESISDSVEMARVIIPAQAELIDTQKVIIKSQSAELSVRAAENMNYRDLVRNDSIVKRLLFRANDSLTKVITNLPPPPKDPDKFLGFKLPSRKAVLVGGVLIGIAADLYLRR